MGTVRTVLKEGGTPLPFCVQMRQRLRRDLPKAPQQVGVKIGYTEASTNLMLDQLGEVRYVNFGKSWALNEVKKAAQMKLGKRRKSLFAAMCFLSSVHSVVSDSLPPHGL